MQRALKSTAGVRRPLAQSPSLRLIVRVAALLMGAACATSAAQAHPHVWVTMTSELVYAPDGAGRRLPGLRALAWSLAARPCRARGMVARFIGGSRRRAAAVLGRDHRAGVLARAGGVLDRRRLDVRDGARHRDDGRGARSLRGRRPRSGGPSRGRAVRLGRRRAARRRARRRPRRHPGRRAAADRLHGERADVDVLGLEHDPEKACPRRRSGRYRFSKNIMLRQ